MRSYLAVVTDHGDTMHLYRVKRNRLEVVEDQIAIDHRPDWQIAVGRLKDNGEIKLSASFKRTNSKLNSAIDAFEICCGGVARIAFLYP
jgi:hypothetical protein